MELRPAVASRDTSLEVQQLMDAHYRAMCPADKLALVASLTATVDELVRARLRRDDPSATVDVIEEHLRALVWPQSLHQAFFAARARWLQARQ